MDKAYSAQSCIDFKSMYAAEKKKVQQAAKILQIKRDIAFNLLQDMRHLLILDVRSEEEFKANRIVNSFHFPLVDVENSVTDFLKYCKKSQEALIDTTDDHRRLLIVTSEASQNIDEIKPLRFFNLLNFSYFIFPPILKGAQAFHKVMQLKDGFKDFEEKYRFLCVNDDSSDDDVKRAQSRYPSEIVADKLFLGNFINSLNEEHFVNLNIKKIIGLTPNKAEKMEESGKITKYVHLEMNELNKPQLDFEAIIALINETLDEGPGAVLIYCLQGNLSAAVCIKYLMLTRKVNREIAAALVMSKRPEVKNIPSWIFQQLDPPEF